MEFAFPWPYSQGEWLGWWSALVTALFGLLLLLMPRTALRLLRLQPAAALPGAVVGEARSTVAGFHLGIGLSCLLLAQPLLYLALGACWGLAAFGRLVSIVADRGATPRNWALLAVEAVLAALPLAFVLGFVA